MSRVKIINLKQGPIVVNSLKITIAGNAFIIRDSSVVGDSDLAELESEGLIKIEGCEEVNKPAVVTAAIIAKPDAKSPSHHGKQPEKKTAAKNGKKPIKTAEPQTTPVVTPTKTTQSPKPGTDFRAVDPEDEEMVVVAGRNGLEFRKMEKQNGDSTKTSVMDEDGPKLGKMSPGLNSRKGPKYVGDTKFGDNDGEAEVDLPDNGDIQTV